MKKIVLIACLVSFLNTGYAQDYTPMFEIGKIWNMYVAYDTPGGYYFNLTVTETAEINGLTYHHIEASHNNCDVYLREDINEKKIYYIWEGEEYVLFDFSLNIGDYLWINGEFMLITDIAYSDFFGMQNLRYLVLDYYTKLIEGIGFESVGIGETFEPKCLYLPIYQSLHLVNMNQPLAVPDLEQSKMVLYPNPVNDVLRIATNGPLEIREIEVYSITGKLVLSAPFQIETQTVDVSGLNDGIYFLKMETEIGYLTQKIVKIAPK